MAMKEKDNLENKGPLKTGAVHFGDDASDYNFRHSFMSDFDKNITKTSQLKRRYYKKRSQLFTAVLLNYCMFIFETRLII